MKNYVLLCLCVINSAVVSIAQEDTQTIPETAYARGALSLPETIVKKKELPELDDTEKKLGITFDIGYFSQYLWYGIDFYADDHSATQSSITVSLYDTGFGFQIWNSLPNTGGFENSKEFDYIAFYSNSLWKESRFATDYIINYIYVDLYDNPSKAFDTQELGIDFSWPNLCSAIVPHYYIAKLWPTGSKVQKDVSGWIHCLGFSRENKISGILPEDKDLPLIFTCDLVYNDGYGLAAADHDWSHITMGLSSPMEFGKITLTPTINYQLSMDDSINDEDELYYSLNLTYSF